ncbi:excisionase family DNA-binding protein [uncultured Ruegeria sp.]|uniref:excisionase family DNA-binding protein n=1 Tax=uncultured Ruegeria sp. TaxID=259304 RepID=UPI002628D634|nr:excisionase family DNA-binding protein [uncultured Ruegeria sp.]
MTIEEAAKLLNVPKGSLRSAAEKHGFLVRIGRAVRIDQDQLGDLVEKCKVAPVVRPPHQPKPVQFSEDDSVTIRFTKGAEELAKELKRKGRKS